MDSYKLHWDIVENIYSKNSKEIFVIKNNTDEDDVLILKIGKNVEDELHIIRKYEHLFVNSPYFSLSFTNRTKYWDINWFIMNMYDCNLEMDLEFGKNNINKLIENIIDSIKSIHNTCPGLVHLDIKLQNILIDKLNCEFKLSDYELLEEINDNPTKLIEEDYDKIIYYISRGVRLDDELVSFKTDLLCFGNVIWRVIDNTLPKRLEKQCEKIRKGIITTNDIQEMSELQDEMYDHIPEQLIEYYEMVFNIDWEWLPTKEYYEDLKKCLLKGISK
jgi:serine/threonine protein kinase